MSAKARYENLFGEGKYYRRHLLFLGVGLAFAAMLLLGIAALGTRLGAWPYRTGFEIMAIAGYAGLAASPLALFALTQAVKWRNGRRALLSFVATATAIATFYIPLTYKREAARLPPIHDLTTDPDNPPRFVAIRPLRRDAPNSADYGGEEIAAQQRRAYPRLKSKSIELPIEVAMIQALATAQAMGWKIVANDPATGRIEATDTTFWFGFQDDIVIRLTPVGKRTRVDLRSLSRVGRGDVGTNAQRIEKYLAKLSPP